MARERQPDHQDRGDDQHFYHTEASARLSSAALHVAERIEPDIVIGHGPACALPTKLKATPGSFRERYGRAAR